MNRIKHPSLTLHKQDTATRDFAHIMLGGGVGHGQNRSVWAMEFCDDLVIKFEGWGDDFQNVMEWSIWKAVKGGPLEKWFAPCMALSPNGVWLVQKKITFPPKEKYPKKMPAFFGDLKYVNYGLYQNRWVACDYGTPSLAWLLSQKKQETAAKWLVQKGSQLRTG